MIDLNLNPTLRVLRQFAGTWLVVFGAFAASQWMRGNAVGAVALGMVAVIVCLAGVLRPRSIRWLFVASSVAAFPIGWALSQLMLIALFVGVITPVAIVFKLIGRDRLWRARQSAHESYWKPKATTADMGRYLRQY